MITVKKKSKITPGITVDIRQRKRKEEKSIVEENSKKEQKILKIRFDDNRKNRKPLPE